MTAGLAAPHSPSWQAGLFPGLAVTKPGSFRSALSQVTLCVDRGWTWDHRSARRGSQTKLFPAGNERGPAARGDQGGGWQPLT